MMRGAAILFAALIAAPAAAPAATFDPVGVSVEDILACRMDARHYNGLISWLTGPDNGAAKRKWTRVEGRDPTVVEYRLPTPANILGHTTDRIALAGTAVLAILPDVAPASIAGEAGIQNTTPTADRFLGERVIDRQVERDADLGMDMTYKRVLIVTVLTRYPGMTFAGCSYRTEEGQR
ncbi:hypothetical protein ACFB49_20570 [Sphingomonas sp. DBB INV C78]|uniref:hypothetical protein n=1 Tax=Sphingomonas sp. DBB INV C78 TaxID=3349434 RepID=UPI0036D31B4D